MATAAVSGRPRAGERLPLPGRNRHDSLSAGRILLVKAIGGSNDRNRQRLQARDIEAL